MSAPSDPAAAAHPPAAAATAASSSSGLTFKLHPLVIVNVSDHHTRVKAQAACSSDGAPPRVFGCVIGVQRGRTVEIFNSFELVLDPVSGTLNRAFLEKKQELYKKLMDVNESPVYLLLNPAINLSQKDLPLNTYESELHVIDGSPQLIFVRSNYTIETVEAERISVDHVAHLKPSDGGSAATQLAAHLTGIHSAIKMLNSRVRVIHQYLVAMQRGDIPLDNSLLRQVSSLVRRLPAMESEKLLMGVPCSSIPRRNKPRRVDLYYSSWCIRAVASRRGTGGLTACEVLLFHHEDMGIPYEIAKIGIQQGMWGCVKRIEPGLRAEEDIVVSDLSHNPTSKFAYWIHPDVVLAWRKEVIWLTVVHAIESSRTLMYICAAGCWMMRGGEEME